jgi:predicted DNA-binding protein (MmcQ/YjbR family)
MYTQTTWQLRTSLDNTRHLNKCFWVCQTTLAYRATDTPLCMYVPRSWHKIKCHLPRLINTIIVMIDSGKFWQQL